MSVKLSELLEAAVEELAQVAYEMKKRGASEGCFEEQYQRALRAIAPALVEFVILTEDANRCRVDLAENRQLYDKTELIRRYNLANDARDRLFAAMKEAGVTCD